MVSFLCARVGTHHEDPTSNKEPQNMERNKTVLLL
jgi:hypothetical protein